MAEKSSNDARDTDLQPHAVVVSSTDGNNFISGIESKLRVADFDLLVCCPSPLTRTQLLADFCSDYDRQPHPDVHLELEIGKTWDKRVAAQPSLFNGTKFRYGGFRKLPDNESGDSLKIILCLGLTDYRTFVGTNLSPEWEKFLAVAKDDVDRCKHTSSPLGNGAIVETTDHQIVVLQRSADVGEFPGTLVFPGGHSEPDEVGIRSHENYGAITKQDLDMKIATEMFEGIIREVVEETGVQSSTLSEPFFIGVSRRKQNVRPTAFFYVKCALTSAEVRHTYQQAEHSFESTVLHTLCPEALIDAAKRMPGCHQGGAALYQLMREAVSG